MTQNIYDNEAFFEGYSELPRSLHGLDGAPEWPALQALLPELRGLKVLDLGCGFGWFCRWARTQGAARVVGIDVSERMLARAKAETPDAAISYIRADMEHLTLPPASFDLAYSSLALHYIDNLEGLFAAVLRLLHRAARSSSPSSIRFSRPPPIPAGRSMERAGKLGRSMPTSTRAPVAPIGSPRA